ncbi:MAG: PEP-CTERM sorting domain-containing protein [Phycisphaeraceae bacterium]|nr:PEP-CTERM sorting domain-containing protein [Phycisphaeraceae bacterium]
MNLKQLIAVPVLAGCGTMACAEVVVINFEDLAAPTSVTEQYAALGVHFSTTPVVDTKGVLHNSVEVFSYALGSFGTKAAGIWGSPITLTFDSDVSNFSVLMNDTERGTLLGSVRAFDAKGNQIGLVTDFTGPYNTSWFYQSTLALNIGGIRRIELMSDADGAVFDNITFTRIPAPSAASILGLGLLGAARRRRV